jgi:hypothetical protein
MSAKHTPGPWFVRKLERLGEIRDCFVAAPDVLGLAYDAEILGDDEYRDGIERKLADAERIVQCVNAHDELVEITESAVSIVERYASDPADCVRRLQALMQRQCAAIAKATGSEA